MIRLPVELQSMLFDGLTLRELVIASHVSTLWRAVAVRHPAYWRVITITNVSIAALDFFDARLAASGDKPVALRVWLASFKYPIPSLHSRILPAVQRNLFRTDMLSLGVDIAYEEAVFAALRQPAPILRFLDLAVNHGQRVSHAMPRDLFARQAPKLRKASFTNIALHADRLPHAFDTLDMLHLLYREPATFPAAAFTQFPSLTELVICAPKFSVELTGPAASQGRSSLQSVDFSVRGSAFELVKQLAASGSMRALTVPMLDHPSAHVLMQHVLGHGPLEARLHHTKGLFYLEYRALTGKSRSRKFVASPEVAKRGCLPALYVDHPSARTQVHSLSASATVVGLIYAFRELPVCTHFTLAVIGDELPRPPDRPLSLPALQHIDITSPTGVRLTAGHIVAFLNAAFVPLARVVTLTLRGVRLEGDHAGIPQERFVLSKLTV